MISDQMLAVSPGEHAQSNVESCDGKSQFSDDSIGASLHGSGASIARESSVRDSFNVFDQQSSMVPNSPKKTVEDGLRKWLRKHFKLPILLGAHSNSGKAMLRPLEVQDEKTSEVESLRTAKDSQGTADEKTSAREELFGGSDSKAYPSLLSQTPQQFRHSIVVTLEEPFGSRVAWFTSVVLIVTNCVALVLLCLEHAIANTDLIRSTWGIATVVVNCVGTLEAILRIACSPRRRRSLGHTPNFLDVACVLPFWVFRIIELDLRLGWASFGLAARMELWLRLLKLSRYFGGWRLLFLTITEAGPALMLPLAALILIMGFGACVILIAEEASCMHGETDDIVIVGFPDALRFCLLCIIAIDAGPFYDLELKSESARIFVGALMMCGLVVFAMPMSIVGTCFCRIWFQRHTLLFVEAVRRRVERETTQGTEQQLRALFNRYAPSTDADLEIAEFWEFAHCITPNMRAEVILAIFGSCDQNQDGCVSFQELHATVFPEDADLEFLITPKDSEDIRFPSEEGSDPANLFPSEAPSELEGTSARLLHMLENRLRAIERRQVQHEAPLMPPWCQMPHQTMKWSSPSPLLRRNSHGISSSKLSSRRTSGASVGSVQLHQYRRNSINSISHLQSNVDSHLTLPRIQDDGDAECDCKAKEHHVSVPTMIISPPETNPNHMRRRDSGSITGPASMFLAPQSSDDTGLLDPKSTRRRASVPPNILPGPRCSDDTGCLGLGVSNNKLKPRRQSPIAHGTSSSSSPAASFPASQQPKINAWPPDHRESET